MFFAKLVFLAYFALSPIFSLLAPAASTSGVQPMTLEQAQQAAQTMLGLQVSSGYARPWSGAALEAGVSLFDLSGEVSAYLFPVSAQAQAQGYLLVAAYALPQPVLEFSITGAAPYTAAPQVPVGYALADRKPLYLGSLAYKYELVDAQGAHWLLDMNSGALTPLAAEDLSASFETQLEKAAQAPRASVVITGTSGYKLIDGVPDWNQFLGSPYGYACYSGCTPTSAVNVIGYYTQHGYPNLMNTSDYWSAINAMRTYMKTECVGNSGGTYVSMEAYGMMKYTKEHGRYVAYSSTDYATYENFQAEIDAGRPVLYGVWDHPTYGDHSMTGVGYNNSAAGQYIIVHDNWPSTAMDINLLFGAVYWDQTITTFQMTNLFWKDSFLPAMMKH